MLQRSVTLFGWLLTAGILTWGAIALAEDTPIQPANPTSSPTSQPASSPGDAKTPPANPVGGSTAPSANPPGDPATPSADPTTPAANPSGDPTTPSPKPSDPPATPPANPPQDLHSQPGNIINLPKIPSTEPAQTPPKQPAKPDAQAKPDSQTNPGSQLEAVRLEIQLSRRRVFLYRGDKAIKSYPIAIGRPGWETPKGTYKVRQKIKDPTWIHPLKKGVVIPGGDPENPLGRYWIGFWTDGKNWIGFHGTPNPKSVGSPASHGCVRMYNKDVEELFKQVNLGTVVKVIR
jgi:lipoprotein-anchoring transpeptidase ErfK/SrfK